jgi:hypothetical protein
MNKKTVRLNRYTDEAPSLDEASFEAEGCSPVLVTVLTGTDGATVVFIDTTSSAVSDERVRIHVNDGTIFDRNIESNTNYGDELD